MAGGRDYEPSKLSELVLYIADKSLSDSRFGKTKLNKILFFSDFLAYQRTGRAVTGAAYFHLPNGPAPHQIMPVLQDLTSDGRAVIKGEQTFAGTQHRVVALREAILDGFTGEEIAVVDYVLDRLRPMTNTEVSDLSHRTVAWRVTDNEQEIPYGSAMLSSESIPTEEDLAWLGEIANAGVGAS